MLAKSMLAALIAVSTTAVADVESRLVPFYSKTPDVVVLQNDSFVDQGGQAYLQLGFVTGEKAGVYVKVPEQYEYFKVDYFRVLIGSASVQPADEDPEQKFNTQVFFQMGIADAPSTGIPASIENAAQVTPGPYWNDIPAQGAEGNLGCARGGQYVGAALEFTHSGAPSVYRDLDGLAQITHNLLMGIPGGWNYSAVYGLRGDWILRIVGHPATAAECNG